MYATHPLPMMQRSHGHAMARFGMARIERGEAGQRLLDLRQSGCAKAFMPHHRRDPSEVIFLNTAGGLTDQDRLHYELTLGDGVCVTATTQTAERAYASRGLAAEARVTARVGAGGRLDWLPQETILFENSNLHRDTRIDLEPGARCLLVESVVLGRHAMRERLTDARLLDQRLVTCAGRPIWADSVRLGPEGLARMASPALLGDARAFAVIALLGAGAEDALGPLRQVLDEPGTRAAASGWDGKCVARVLAHDGWPLKRQIARILRVLRTAPLPRVWQLQGV
ncbi:urease accessory protein UreD [Pseudorhodobacter sp. E13]|uniref:urease accessory protein UreD n=1 Tax=Pseudorhodobacter sp. E13 TaxID=2487931 RepID=UPI000F8C8BD5|nr:urease accessory protein UreD [Pseudorhodobacter sp. E13]RUS60838.1 urease accessory protein UreD [Pseudorhodobacter sp. E13]